MLAGLLYPLRLPERLLAAFDSLAAAGSELRPIREELVRVREQTEPLHDLMPAVERIISHTELVPAVLDKVESIRKEAKPLAELMPALERLEEHLGSRLDSLHETIVALEGQESHLNTNIVKVLDELAAMHKTVAGLQDDLQRVTDRLPDPNRSPLEKAKDLISGGDE